jgi:hypothetical protein
MADFTVTRDDVMFRFVADLVKIAQGVDIPETGTQTYSITLGGQTQTVQVV